MMFLIVNNTASIAAPTSRERLRYSDRTLWIHADDAAPMPLLVWTPRDVAMQCGLPCFATVALHMGFAQGCAAFFIVFDCARMNLAANVF